MNNASFDDLCVAISLVESGMIESPDAAIELAQNLEARDFVEGVAFGSRDLRRELMRAGRATYDRVVPILSHALCNGGEVRFVVRGTSELVTFVSEVVVANDLPVAVAVLCARIVANEGLEAFCRRMMGQ